MGWRVKLYTKKQPISFLTGCPNYLIYIKIILDYHFKNKSA